ncbi:MAG: DMT family transporter [Kiritimatiellae bacterium]|nr:DMT family transporter [Kiritimatiellia bacterium]
MGGWTTWILASAVFLALYDLAKKASVRDNAVLPTLLCSTCFGCAAYVGALALCGRASALPALTAEIAAISAVKCVVVGTSWVFTFCALRTLPITIATPIRASAPALVFAAAFVVYGERPSPVQLAGMAAMFAGYFAFSWAGRHEGIDFFRNRAVWCAIAGAFCSALSSLWDKYVFQVRGIPVETVQFFFQVGLVGFYGTALAASRVAFRRARGPAFEWRWTIPLVGVLLAAADWLYFTALSIPDAPISAASLLRRFSVVITFLLGARAFHETNLVRKGVALAAILAGVVLICLGG